MRIHIGSDHAGLEFKAKIIAHLQSQGHQVTDHGPHSFDPLDDYPEFCIPAALATAKDPGSFGIVLGGSGNGEQMAANKVKGVRAALVWSVEIAKLARQHNDANVISLGGRMHDEKFVTEKAYDNPKFVEDMVRDVAAQLKLEKRIDHFVVESENFESIHNHSAYALIEG